MVNLNKDLLDSQSVSPTAPPSDKIPRTPQNWERERGKIEDVCGLLINEDLYPKI